MHINIFIRIDRQDSSDESNNAWKFKAVYKIKEIIKKIIYNTAKFPLKSTI